MEEITKPETIVAGNPPPRALPTPKKVQSRRRKAFKIAGIALLLFAIAGIAFYIALPYVTQPEQSQNTYDFIAQNWNSTLMNTNIATTQTITVPNNFTWDNQTYYFDDTNLSIYYIGADYCPYCAMESYPIFYYQYGTILPYNGANYIQAENGLPAINPSLEFSNITGQPAMQNINISTNQYIYEFPITLSDLSTMSQADLNQTEANEISLMTPEAEYLFSLQNFQYPQVYVVKTTGIQTRICSAYAGMPIYQYNATDQSNLEQAFNMTGIPLNTIIPDPTAMNYNYNLLGQCMETLGS